MKLNLTNNALHTLMHAIEHCHDALSWTDEEHVIYNEDDGFVEWHSEDGSFSFPVVDFCPPPGSYNYKFAILHCIQALELIIKARINEYDSSLLFSNGSYKTIGFYDAIRTLNRIDPNSVSENEISLLVEAKNLRNDIEHYQLDSSVNEMEIQCADLVAFCGFLAQKLLHINIIEAFEFDHLRDQDNPAGIHLQYLLSHVSENGRLKCKQSGELWSREHPDCSVTLCVQCGANAFSIERERCMGCGDTDFTPIINKCRNANAIKRLLFQKSR